MCIYIKTHAYYSTFLKSLPLSTLSPTPALHPIFGSPRLSVVCMRAIKRHRTLKAREHSHCSMLKHPKIIPKQKTLRSERRWSRTSLLEMANITITPVGNAELVVFYDCLGVRVGNIFTAPVRY